MVQIDKAYKAVIIEGKEYDMADTLEILTKLQEILKRETTLTTIDMDAYRTNLEMISESYRCESEDMLETLEELQGKARKSEQDKLEIKELTTSVARKSGMADAAYRASELVLDFIK